MNRMASINIPFFLQRNTPKIAVVLISTFLEWILIASLFVNCSLFFLMTKFAYFSGLQPPCISCSLSAFKISSGALLCNDHAKNENVIHKRSKRESETEWCFVVKGGHQKPDFVEDISFDIMHNRCIIDEERLVPVELIDKVTLEDSSVWFIAQKHLKRELIGRSSLFQDIKTADDGNTTIRKDDSRDSISSFENDSPRKDQVRVSLHKTTDENQSMHSYSSLSELIPLETTPFLEPSPKNNVLDEQKTKFFSSSSKSLDSSVVERNKEKTYIGISHSPDQNKSSNKSIFEIAPIATTSLVNPDIASKSISEKLDKLDASVEVNEEELKSKILFKLDESLEKFEEERCSILENLNQLEQRLLIAKKEVQASKNVIKEEKHNIQKDYKSLSDFFNCDMNYSSNDLVNLGKVYDQKKVANLKKSRLAPSLQGFNLKKGIENSVQVHKFDDDMNEHEKLTIKEEIDNLYERLEQINEAREMIKQCINYLNKGVGDTSTGSTVVAQGVLMQLETLK